MTSPSLQSSPVQAAAATASIAYRRWWISAGVLLLLFAVPLWRLMAFAYHDDAQSHILLIPLVSGYLIWLKRRSLPSPGASSSFTTVTLATLGVVPAAALGALLASGKSLGPVDILVFTTTSWVFLLGAVTSLWLGRAVMRAVMFPLGFLLFMVPLPPAATERIDFVLQHGSGLVAKAMFDTVGTPLAYRDLVFRLPGITFEIAPECSGIRSTIALLITSVVAGYFFLRSPWKRLTLAALVIPLAFLRNGFRVFTIGELCVQIDPSMIDSFIHHKGGPIFFALSLIPFVLVLKLLSRGEAVS